MPVNVFGNSSIINDQKIDTSLFVQKLYLRTNYIESNIEEDIDLKNEHKTKNLSDPISIQDACIKNYVDSIIRNIIDSKDVKLENINIVKVNYQPAINQHLTPKIYIVTARDEKSLLRNNQDNDFRNYICTNINNITLNKQAEIDNEVITKAYVEQFHQEKERSRRDVWLDFYDKSSDLVTNNQDKDLSDKKLLNLETVVVIREPSSDNEVANKK